jgi:uncharacterized protein (UPF0332 family)
MNRNMVLAEWLRANASLQAAKNLTQDGLHADAISRAYYAVLHAAKADKVMWGRTAATS